MIRTWAFLMTSHTNLSILALQSEKGKETTKNCAEGNAGKRRKVVVGNFHEEVSPTHFYKVLLTPGLNLLLIPPAFHEHLGQIPKEIVLNTKTGCNCRVSVLDFNGWSAFAMCHSLKIHNFLTFKVLGMMSTGSRSSTPMAWSSSGSARSIPGTFG